MTSSIKMLVGAAYTGDLGHGYARIDEDSMRRLGVERGDIVSIGGGSKTVAMVWNASGKDQDKGLIRMERFIRNNAELVLGNEAKVKKVIAKFCTKVVFSPVLKEYPQVIFDAGIEKALKLNLSNRPFIEGQSIFVPGFKLLGIEKVLKRNLSNRPSTEGQSIFAPESKLSGSNVMVRFKVVQCWPEGIVRMASETAVFVRNTLVRNPGM